MNEQYGVLITGFPLFQGFTSDGAQMLLEYGKVEEYSPGEVLIKERDGLTFVLLVLTGQMQVFIERQRRDLVLNDVGPETILGELAVLCGIPRSASVRATCSCETFLSERIFRESLRTLIEKERSLIASLIRSQGGSN